MQSKSKFNASLKLSTVAKSQKASNETSPVFSLETTPNKFKLNRHAVSAMGFVKGDYIRFFENKECESINERYFIAKTTDPTVGNKLNTTNNSKNATSDVDLAFNNATPWSVIIQGKKDGMGLGIKALTEMGYTEIIDPSKEKPTYKVSDLLHPIKADVESVGEMEIDEITYEVFALTNFTFNGKSTPEIEVKELSEGTSTEMDSEEDED